jgi:hypothetical protein
MANDIFCLFFISLVFYSIVVFMIYQGVKNQKNNDFDTEDWWIKTFQVTEFMLIVGFMLIGSSLHWWKF